MKVETGVIRIDVFDDLLNGMTKEQKIEMAHSICFDNDVLNDFVDRLMTEYAGPQYNSDLHDARLRMVKLMPQAANDVIKALVREVEIAKAAQQRYYDWAWELWHTWDSTHDASWAKRPEPPAYEGVSTPSADEIMTKCGYAPVPAQPE